MGQHEVAEWLATQRKAGNNGFFTVGEIRAGLKINGYGYLNVDLQASQLYHYGILEMRRNDKRKNRKVVASYGGWWRRSYRIKALYVGGKS